MNKTLELLYTPVIPIKNYTGAGWNKGLSAIWTGELSDNMSVSFNGQPLWESICLPKENIVSSGSTQTTTVNFDPSITNTISFVNEQQYGDYRIRPFGNITITPLSSNQYQIDFVYNWRDECSEENYIEIQKGFKVKQEGFTFEVNNFKTIEESRIIPGIKYTSNHTLTWNTTNPIIFTITESGQTIKDIPYKNSHQFTLT